MRRILTAASCILTAIGLISCNKSLEKTFSRQGTDIEGVVTSLTRNNKDATVDYMDGVVRVTVVHGDGETLSGEGVVSFYYAGYLVNGKSISQSDVFTTNYDVFANSIKWNVTDPDAFTIATVNLAEESLVGGLETGLPGVKAGDECWILFNGKHGFGKKGEGQIPPNAALAYHLWIKGVTN